MAKKKAGRKPKEELYESYAIKLFDWRLDYSFSAHKDSRWFDPLSDYSSLEIDGEFLEPEKVKGRQLTLSFLANRELDEVIEDPSKLERDPVSIGSLTSRGKQSSYLGSLPFKAFPIVISMLENDKCQGILLHGTKLRYGSASIRSLHFVDERELIEEFAEEA